MIITVITSMVIMAVTTNIAISLGMLGALSIVRFRTPVKDPLDIVYIFWAVGAGIITGAGMLLLALFGSLFVGFMIAIMSNLKVKQDPYLLIVNFESLDTEQSIFSLLNERVKKYKVKSKSIYPNGACELTVEVIIKNEDSDFLNLISDFEGVTNAVMVSYNGDYSI
jgi:uncharacterized membrane protein YhiD involved in acid resistance